MADEKKYIEAEASLSLLVKNWRCTKSADDAIQKTIDEWDSIPAADVRPVERGVWIEAYNKWTPTKKCSACEAHFWQFPMKTVGIGEPIAPVMNFCPSCGADMRAEE